MYNIVVFDTETTGTECEIDRLVELAGVSLDGITDFTTFVNPEREIPAEAKAIHHILEHEVMGAPLEPEAVQHFLNRFFVDKPGNHVLAAHNAKFDRGFISRIKPEWKPQYICTYKCSLLAFPDAPRHTNQVLRYYLGLDVSVPDGLFPHRALYDAIVTRAILRELLTIFSVERLIDISANPVLLPKVPFGKHAGKTWDQVDYGYLKWALGPTGPKDNEDFIHTANYWMRKGSGNFGGRR